MIEINLLPKELQWKRFRLTLDRTMLIILGVGLAVTFCMAAYSYVYQASVISGLKEKISDYEQEAKSFTSEIQQIEEMEAMNNRILNRMAAIESLDKNRDYWVTVMEDLVRRVPDYLWLNMVREASAGGQVQAAPGTTQPPGSAPPVVKSTVEGYSFSLNALATFIVRLKKSELFKTVEVSSIILQENEDARAYSFKLTFDLSAPGTQPQTVETAGAPGAGSNRF